jgi:hypothetical protein
MHNSKCGNQNSENLTDIPHNPYLVLQHVYIITGPFMFPAFSDIANVPTGVFLHTYNTFSLWKGYVTMEVIHSRYTPLSMNMSKAVAETIFEYPWQQPYLTFSNQLQHTQQYITLLLSFNSSPLFSLHYIDIVLPSTTSFPIILHEVFPNKLHTLNIYLQNYCLHNLTKKCGTNLKSVVIRLRLRGRWHRIPSGHRILSARREHIVIVSSSIARSHFQPRVVLS